MIASSEVNLRGSKQKTGGFGGVQQRNIAQETKQNQVPLLCSAGCRFYGKPCTKGMCSVCSKGHPQRRNSTNGRISPPTASVSSLPQFLPIPVRRWQCHLCSVSARIHVCICAAKCCIKLVTFIVICSIFPGGQCICGQSST